MGRQYVIMAGGYYSHFDRPKALMVVGGETIVGRTVRLLKSAGINPGDILITGTDERLRDYGVEVLVHDNSYRWVDGKMLGYWLDAFYPFFDDDIQLTFLYGDVVYSPEAIDKIVTCKRSGNILFGTSAAKNTLHKNWGEPFAFQVDDYRTFMDGVDAVKKLHDEGKLKRHPITWELYRYLNGLDVNVQAVKSATYICIDDGTIDIDAPWVVEKAEKRL